MPADTSLKDDLTAAFSAVEAQVETTPEPSPEPTVTETEPLPPPAAEATEVSGEGRVRDEKGRFAPKAGDPQPPPAAKPPAAQAAPDPAKPAEPPAEAAQVPKAPASWKPEAREEWAKVPPRVRDEVMRREKEIQLALQESSEARQTAQKYREIVTPYEQMIRAEGGEPTQAIQGLLQTAYMLRHAPMPVRAQGIARMVATFLGREGLELLDQHLAPLVNPNARPPAGPAAPPQQPPQFRDPRLDELLANAAREKEARAQAELAKIQDREFFEDVRDDMADVLEAARKRGVVMSLDEAYARAIRVNPDVARVIEQREAAGRAGSTTDAARARAASSVRSTPATPPKGGQDEDLRSTIARIAGESR